MSSIYKLLQKPHHRLTQIRHLSSILSPNSSAPLSAKDKSRAALSLLKSEKNPETILDICRAASLTPETHLDRIVFSIAISKLADSNYYEGIRNFLKELQTTRPDLQNERFLSHCIVLYGQAGLVDDALKLFDEMPKLRVAPKVKSLNALLFSCIIGKKYSEVNRVFVDFPKKYGIVPNLETYNCVIKGFCESGMSNSGYSVLAEMKRKKVKPNMTTFGTWVAGFYAEEKLDDVGKVMEMMKKYGIMPNINFYNIRILSLCKLRRAVEAKALLDGLLSRGMKPNSTTYYHLIHGFCKEGNLEEAKRLFKSMGYRGCKADSDCYFTLVYFLCQGGDFVSALEIYKESMEKGWVPSFSTMKLLVNGLASVSKNDEGLELIGQMKEKFPKFADRWTEVEEGLAK